METKNHTNCQTAAWCKGCCIDDLHDGRDSFGRFRFFFRHVDERLKPSETLEGAVAELIFVVEERVKSVHNSSISSMY